MGITTEGIKENYERRQEKIAQQASKLLEQRFDFGKRLYKDRSELHER